MPRHCFSFALPLAAFLLASPHLVPAQASTSTEPAMQLPPDQAAFKTANAIVDRQARAAALQGFLNTYAKSRRVDTARRILLDLLVDQPSRDERRIHDLAKASVDSAGKDSRAREENSVAYTLAEALPNGIDLKSAEAWARDSVKRTTLEQVRASFGETGPLTPAAQAERDANVKLAWSATQAANLQTLADVYFHQGKLAEATAAIDQADTLNPSQGANFVTRGQIAHAQHHDEQALDALKTAEVYGGMTPAAQDLLGSLYAAQHGGDRSGLEAEIDRRYAALYKPMPPATHPASNSGRTVLLALYTGAACEPCAAADLAVDAVLQNYSRNEVVAIALDQHIPDPDPLANPSSVARGTYDGIHYTPSLFLDGREGPGVYGRRPDADKAYRTLAAALDKQLAVPSGASLHVTARLTPARTVLATANFQVTDAAALQHLLLAKPSSKAGVVKPAGARPETTPTPVAIEAPKLVLNFALVQREVRYSGENGIRFHAEVVRDIAKPTAEAFPVAQSSTTSASFTFDPAAISASLAKYLAGFAQHNERFGSPHFLTTDTALPLDGLAVAAWVEDLTSHQVVAAAYTPLGNAAAEQAAR